MCQLTLIDALVKSFSEGTNGYVQASGKIKWFQIISSIILLSNLPIGYILFKLGFEPFSIMVCFIVSSIVYRCVSLYMMKRILGFDSVAYVKNAYLRPISIIIMMWLCCHLNEMIVKASPIQHIMGILVIAIITLILVVMIGLDPKERRLLFSIVRNN